MENAFPNPAVLSEKISEITAICHAAWQKNLLDGWSGNASARLPDSTILITASGSPKGNLFADDFVIMDLGGKKLGGAKNPSSESLMHACIYRKVSACMAILHTHPAHMQAAGLILTQKGIPLESGFLNISLYEAAMWRKKLFFADALEPGSYELAEAAQNAIPRTEGNSLELPCAIWLRNHGLCALGKNLRQALCLTEELEHIAQVQIACF